jgi:nitrate/TMAO reductase-like tetraheme cytochrome c subunit
VWTTPTTLPDGHMPIPGTQTCSVCHIGNLSTIAGYATMASIPILHTGITSGCAQCHGGATALTFYNNNDNPKAAASLSPPHIPAFTGQDCSTCHKANYAVGGFGPMNMTQATHAGVGTVCKTCHEAGLSFYMGAASPGLQGRPADHTAGQQVAPNDCSLCHTTANWLTTVLPTGHMPNPANLACNVCHTAAPTNYAALAANSVLHTGIAGNCSQCHGATQLSFYNNNDPPKSAALAPAHIPYLSGTDCGSCHSSATYAAGTFGPMNMTQAKHAFVATTCATCHEAGRSFYMGAASPALQGRPADHTAGQQVAPNDCSLCHTTADWNSNVMPAGHMPNPANKACNVCHTAAPVNYTTLAANSVLHTGIASGCAACHGGTTALTWYNNFTPKDAVLSPAHIPYLSGTDCASCHSSTTYAAGTFGPMNMTQAKHAFVATTCITCHEAGRSFYMGAASPALQGRPADHTSGQMVAPNDCSLCHTTANWNSTTMPAGHMPNPANQACTVCHTAAPANYTTLAANLGMHTGITSSQCAQCHGGTTALTWYNNYTPKDAVLTPAHIPFLSGTSCGSCHSSTTYAAGTFGPMNMTQAKHAFVSTNCVTCHEKGVSLYMGAASPALQGRPADHTTGQMVAPNNCSICHTTANWNSTALPAGHMPNPGNQACTVCHTAAPANYATLATNAVLHTGIATGCITCHGAPNATKPVFYLNFSPKAASGLSPPHIPTAATACESCHAISFTAFSGTTMSAAKHTAMLAATGGTCDQCHDLKTLTFYGVTNLTTRPNGHHVGQDCKGCHSPNNWGGNAQKRTVAAANTPTKSTIGTVVTASAATRASALPAAGPNGGDRGFRGGPIQSAVALGQSAVALGAVNHSVSHAGVTGNCASCHNGVLAAGKGAAHIASNNACQNCHTIVAWLPARFDHQGVTAKCVSCHNGVVALGKPTLHVQTNQDCSACHGTITWTAVMFSHLGINAACQTCHNGITATGKQVQHVRTTLDCASCHNTLNWTVVSVQPKPSVPATPRPVTPNPRGANSGSTK